MKYLVQVTPSFEAANKLDAGPGGPGPLFAHIGDRFKPEAFYVGADSRTAWWVIDFDGPQSMTEFLHIMVQKAGTEPRLSPVMRGTDATKVIPAACDAARKAP
jgi:hypothetical protein